MRRVITGTDEWGRSAVLYAGPPQSVHHTTSAKVGALEIKNVPAVIDPVPPGQACIVDLWSTDGPPAANSPDPMDEPQQFILEPPGKGMLIRYQSWGPNLDSSAMHATDTLDVDFILGGQVELLLDDDVRISLEAGDSVVIPGVRHGWRAGPEGVQILIMMHRLA